MKTSSQALLALVRRNWLPLAAGGGVALGALLGGFFFFSHPSVGSSLPGEHSEATTIAAPAMPDGYVRRLSDGVPVPPEQQAKQWFAVMVENSAEAWPLSGLSAARLVIEAPVEGTIPRLSVYFDDTQVDVKKIGPVRSVRPYYLDWAAGFNAMLAHVGGSPEALSLVDTRGSVTLNEFFWGRFFWRSLDRYAPHNVYTSVGMLTQGFAARGYEVKDPVPTFTYTDGEPAVDARPSGQTISIPFSSMTSDYDAGWVYDRDSNAYLRKQGDDESSDAEGHRIVARNVVVLYMNVTVIDDVGRRAIKTTGQGDATLFRDGQAFHIVWKKDRVSDPLRFETKGGDSVAFNSGTTWLEIVPLSTSVTVSPQ